VSTQDALIQLVCNQDTNETALPIPLKANIPFILGRDDSKYNPTTVDTWESTGSAGVIDRIEIYQESGSTAKVRVVAIT
jgi:hypothetical protein